MAEHIDWARVYPYHKILSQMDRRRAISDLPLPLPPPPAFLQPTTKARGEDLVLLIRVFYAYWKSKVFNVHSDWKDVSKTVDVGALDDKTISVEKYYENRKVQKFKLGSRVKIIGENKRLFKQLHRKVGIRKETLVQVIGKEAIIMGIFSGNLFEVVLLDGGVTEVIHGFALEKIEGNGQEEGFWQNNTDFKPGDDVVIAVEDSVLSYLQKDIKKTPFEIAQQLQGTLGRVVTVFTGQVVVTFDEMHTEIFNPAAIKRYFGKVQTKKSKSASGKYLKDIRKDDKVAVIEDFREAWITQVQGGGEWKFEMTKFLGKEGTVEGIIPGENIIVRFNAFESYVFNSKIVHKSEQKKKKTPKKSSNALKNGLQFQVGDIVRLRMPPDDLLSFLHLLRIPNSFARILCQTRSPEVCRTCTIQRSKKIFQDRKAD